MLNQRVYYQQVDDKYGVLCRLHIYGSLPKAEIHLKMTEYENNKTCILKYQIFCSWLCFMEGKEETETWK